ncbi:MAG: hypothetical protein WC661_03500 [Opitutaceae bacterium]|jgi:hypothetical protein
MSSSPRRSRFFRPCPTRRAQSGFALLITITLLAFLVLLLVSLAALTRVETQVAANGQQLAQARQNALMALNIALGELQKAAGPDQRTTATAVLGESATAIMAANTADNGLGATANGTRHWTGVWGNKSAPDGIFTAAPQPVLLRWLVSGNENGPTVTTAADGHISAPAVAADTTFKPSGAVTFSSGGSLSTSATATADLLIRDNANSNQSAVLLVGGKTAGANVDAFVVAPLVTINSSAVPGLSGPARVGRYAWWVGDEGVKAKYNLPDAYISNATPDSGTSTNSRDSRYRLLAAQRNGIERITAFGDTNYPLAATSATSALYLGVGNTLTPAGIRLAAPAVTTTALQRNFHDLTTYSYGVLADSQFGGLRRDLTFHLDANSGDTFLAGRAILPDGATPVSNFPGSFYAASPSLFSETTANGGLNFTTLNVSPRLGPKWDQLKSYYKLAYDTPTDLEVQPAVDLSVIPVKVQAAITPVILESRMMFSLKAGPSIDTAIIVVLGNPYSRRLTAPSGMDYRIALHPNRHTSAKFRGEELGLICNFVRTKPSDPSKKEISSVFTRRQGDSLNFPTSGTTAAPTAPPLVMDYVDPGTLPQTLKDAGNTVFHHYYPILKFPVPADGDGPVDPDAGYPGVLDNVVFRLPGGLLDLDPGQARAYQINPGNVSTEMIGGVSTTVVALQKMTSIAPTYYTHMCNPHYLSDASVFSPSMFTVDSFFRAGLTITSDQGAFAANWDYTLTMPGRPGAVLQSLGPVGGIVWDTLLNRMLPSHTFISDVFKSSPTPISGVLHNRVLSYRNTAVYAERNLAGSRQSNAAWYNTGSGTNPYIAASILSPANFDAFVDASSFTNDLDPGNPIQAAWGQGEIGSPLRTEPQGKLVLFDAPSAGTADEIPLLSLGQLQHADLTGDDEALGVNSQPGGVLGNSWYNRLVKRDSSRTDPVENSRAILFSRWENTSATALGDTPRYPGYVPDLPKNTMIRRYDMSYLINAALWDSWFFSTVRPAAGSATTTAPLPANRRMAYAGGTPTLGQLRGADASAVVPVPGSLGLGENGRVPAAHMLANGAFNVNSTSVEAWTALLSGLRGLGVSTTAADPELTPFARSIRQPGGAQNVLPSNPHTQENTYTGFRTLTDAQISALAVQIVAQVKARGPFLSLSQFVNRNLTAANAAGDAVADTGLAGALQQAIDRSGINANLNTAALSLALETNAVRLANNRAIYPDYDLMPTGAGSGLGTYMGAPGWLSQADLLQAIAPSLSARSDTFVIRVYGETVDPVNSPAAPAAPVVTGRAWCEAVVQREADYVDTAVRPSVLPSAAGATNQAFGRRFRIVSFRWLSPDDI